MSPNLYSENNEAMANEPIENYVRHLEIARKRWSKLSNRTKDKKNDRSGQEIQQEYIRKAGILEPLLYRIVNNELMYGERKRLLERLQIKSPQTIYNLAARCLRHKRLFPTEPLVYALVKLSGRPKQELFTPDQELFIIGAYLLGDWEVRLPNGKIDKSRDRVSAEFVHNLLCRAYSNLEVSVRQVERFISEKSAEEHIVFTLGREGARKVWQDYMPKLPNRAPEPHYRWQSDARILPVIVYKKIGKRIVKYTLTIVVIIDDYSLAILNWCLVERVIESEVDPEELKRVDFVNGHVRMLMAGAMEDWQARPKIWYTDRGSQYIAIVDFIPWLTSGFDDDHPIIPIQGFPGHPWARGKVEVLQKLIDTVLRKLSGFVHDEDDRQSWKEAHKKTNILYKDVQSAVQEFVKNWNTEAIDGKPSRIEQLKQAGTVPLLPPPVERLVLFAASRQWGIVTVRDTGLPLPDDEYTIKALNTEEGYQRWQNAIGKKARYCVIPLSKGQHVLASLDGAPWEPIVPTKQVSAGRRHSKRQRELITVAEDRLQEYRNHFERLCSEIFGAVPQLSVLGNEITIPEPKNSKAAAAGASKDKGLQTAQTIEALPDKKAKSDQMPDTPIPLPDSSTAEVSLTEAPSASPTSRRRGEDIEKYWKQRRNTQ